MILARAARVALVAAALAPLLRRRRPVPSLLALAAADLARAAHPPVLLDRALFFAWPAPLAVLALRAWRRPTGRAILLGVYGPLVFAGAWEADVVGALPEEVRAQLFLDVVRAGRLAALAVVVAVGRWPPRSAPQAVALALAASGILDQLGPLFGDAWARWDVGRPLALVTWLSVGAILILWEKG